MTERFPALAAFARRLSAYLRVWVLGWALLGVIVAAALALGPLEGVPHAQDEVVYQLQARLLSEGKLWEEELRPRAAFHYEFVINADGRRYGIFPNGWPAVLAIGVLLGASWLVNPLLHGLTVLAGAWLARRASGRAAAFLAAPLLATCPALVVQAASRMSHTLCALLALVATAVVLTGEARRSRVLAAGAAIAWVWFTRPLDGLVLTAVLTAVAIATRRVAVLRWALVPVMLGVGLVLLQNLAYEGSPLRFPQTVWFARGEPPHPDTVWRYTELCNTLGWGPGHGCMPIWSVLDHSFERGLNHSWLNLQLAGSLWYGVAPLGLLSAGAWLERSLRPLALSVLALIAALAFAYTAYWYHGACYGPRFLHSAAPLAVVLLAGGLAALAARAHVPAALGLLALLTFAERMPAVVRELEGYWGVDGRLRQLEQRWDRGPALLFVAYGGLRENVWQTLPNTSEPYISYPATLRRGMWFDHRGPLLVYAEHQPRLVEEVQRRFPGRAPYLLVLHDQRRLDYLVPLTSLPADPRQVTELTVPQSPTFLRRPLPGAIPIGKYYEP
jgi:hypothetical protein